MSASRARIGLLLGTTAFVVVLDQWTKHLVHSRFRWGESVPVLEGLFSLTYVRNMGAAFGLLHKAPAWFRDPFFIIVPIVALFVILYILVTLPKGQRVAALGLSLIFAGAIGNLIDRVRFGYVIDFLDFYWNDWHWPAFNVADCCIVVGVGLMFVLSFIQGRKTPGKPIPEPVSGISSSSTQGASQP